jgi:hypothetical protein
MPMTSLTVARNTPRRVVPPPLWLVSNGETSVGPVNSDLLRRGVWHSRIPEDCVVRALTWRTWRPLHEIREVRAVLAAREAGDLYFMPSSIPSTVEIAGRLARASDAAEVLSLALGEACTRTGAGYAVIHRAFRAWGTPMTTCVRGIGMSSRLGCPLPENDPSIALARLGGVVVAPPDAGRVEGVIAERFGAPGDLAGVAMVPIVRAEFLYAVIELGRVGHGFRTTDLPYLERVADASAHVIAAFEAARRWCS